MLLYKSQMYTSSSKHLSLSPNHILRPQRDLSPSNKHQGNKTKYYSTEEVNKLIKSYIQPKILYLRNQLEEKNRVIQELNEKLDNNDNKISQLYKYAQNMIKKQRQAQQSQQSVQLVNQLINDKLKQYWQTVNGQIQKIKQFHIDSNRIDTNKIQARIQDELQNIRKQTLQFIEQTRVKNNSYWLKIKQALNRINSKVTKIDDTLITTISQLQQFKQTSLRQFQQFQQIHKAKSVVKKVIQLKKSVQNIYENYSNLLELQNMLKNKISSFETENKGIHVRSSQQKLKINDLSANDSQIFDFIQDKKASQQTESGGGNTFPMFRKKNNSNFPIQQVHQQQNQYFMSASQQSSYGQPTQSNFNYNRVKFDFQEQDSTKLNGQENFALQYSKDENNSEVFYHQNQPQMNRKSQNEPVFPTKYYVPGNKKNNNSGFLANQLSPIKSTPSQSSKFQQGMNSPTDLSCLNSSVNALRHGASRSTSFVNLSLQNRNQMSQSVKERLQQIIELKNLSKPLFVYLDEINYLKNSEGNYIFDTRGNMFKINLQEGKQLQKMGIISFIDKGLGNSTQKRKNNQMLDKLAVPQNLRSKSSQMPKPRSIIIKQTQI